MKKFPVYKCDYIFNKYCGKKPKKVKLKLKGIELEYPCRLDAMAINPAAVSYNDSMIFTPGEVLVSINKKIKTKIEVIDKKGGIINVSDKTKRKVLVKHAYYLLCDALKVKPSLNIEVIDDFPSKFLVDVTRQHRWARGDTQIIGWLGNKVRNKENKQVKNPINLLGKYKILDNKMEVILWQVNLDLYMVHLIF